MQFHRSDFPISIAEALGDRLKRARLNKNLTQNEVAQLAWISRRSPTAHREAETAKAHRG